MRSAVMRDWEWLRRSVDRDPNLLRRHRTFLATCAHVVGGTLRPASKAPTAPTVGAGTDLSQPRLLTTRESDVLVLLAQMNSTEEIAGALVVSTNTVKTHLKGIFAKLGVSRRVDAVRRGQELGLC
jgi:ATP/maltotriose-dependent transcriptional regulator MalT